MKDREAKLIQKNRGKNKKRLKQKQKRVNRKRFDHMVGSR